jgi:hypothetical protein
MSPQSTIAHYRIISKLGQGGMGEVWRATDTKLNREVAIKILPDVFAQDADRMARFSREAQVLASLNHPHIAALYGLEERALVMELVPGPTLAERISQGPIPLDEALSFAKQIAEALEYAHERGVVHRDLKPANIKITPEGVVKVLDFGLAKVADPIAPPADAANSPTLTIRASEVGMIMGTAAYMSPEQASGKVADRRADIWSFGVVWWEMLAGHSLFEGETVSHTLADVLRGPIDMRKLPAGTPPAIRELLRRCLDRDVKNRLRDIGEARVAIDQYLARPVEEHVPARRAALLPWATAAVLAVIAGVALWALWRAPRSGPEGAPLPLTRLSVDLGPDALTGFNLTAVISPDGRRLVYPARAANGKQQLATRLLDQAQASLLPGTENGSDPFFSPDSQWIGFFATGKLKKISALGGTPVTLCDAPFTHGASWGDDGTIIGSLNLQSPLSRVPAAGGRPQSVSRLGKGEFAHFWPQILPGGQALLFTASLGFGMENNSVAAISLPSGVTKTLIAGGYFGLYMPSSGTRGYLVYLHQSVLWAVAFDPVRLEPQGTPVPMVDDLAASPQGGGQFTFSAAPSGHGTLVYLEGKGAAQNWPVMWLDSSGNMQPLITTPGLYGLPRFSPDGRRLALTMTTSGGTDIYVYELGRETIMRLTFGGHSQGAVWTPDGKHVAFRSIGSDSGIGWIRSDGSGEPLQILAAPDNTNPWSFSPEGQRLAYHQTNSGTGLDLLTLPLDTSDPDHPKAGKPEPFLATPSDELVPMFSPDGRWIAYRSNESGTNEIYVRSFPAGRGGKWQISTGGGVYEMWSNNGRELFYETEDHRIMVVDYTVSADSFLPGKPRLWSEKQIFYAGGSNLALAPDGKRFAVFPMPEAAVPGKGTVHVSFLLNFVDELRRKVP